MFIKKEFTRYPKPVSIILLLFSGEKKDLNFSSLPLNNVEMSLLLENKDINKRKSQMKTVPFIVFF